MKTSALKNSLIENISQIDDKTFLHAINTIIENKIEKSIYKLTAKQRAEIEKSQKEIAKGNFTTDTDLQKEIDQWQKRK